MKEWHRHSAAEAIELVRSSETGLSEAEAASRIAVYGHNELQEHARKHPLRMLGEQFAQTLVVILIIAACVSLLLGRQIEAFAILAIVVLFAVLGFLQEHRAERAMVALKKMTVPVVRVRRSGALREISARELVPGDVIVLETGNAVPADVRLLESVNLRIQEAALTGESEPAEKQTDPLLKSDLPLGDRSNMAYLGTAVTYGRGSAVVVGTGMHTELGKIAELIQDVGSDQTPLQKRLDQLGKILAVAGLASALLVFCIGWLNDVELIHMFLAAISMAVAVVPEGLPAVVTITLALGAQRMLKRQVLIRKLPAVETLGSVTVICSDKTGTLTENRMTVTIIDIAGEKLDLTETISNDNPELSAEEYREERLKNAPLATKLTLAAAALCNDAELKRTSPPVELHTIGDPTEAALLVAAAQAGLIKDELQAHLPRVAEYPFDSNRKRMTTVHRVSRDASLPECLHFLSSHPYVALTKGAVDGLVGLVTRVYMQDHIEPMNEVWRSRIHKGNEQLARDGMRMLGVAFRALDHVPEKLETELEADLVYVGTVGMIDPPRPAVRPAVETCTRAGIRPIMITGDHPLTAAAIARDLKIGDSAEVITGQDLNRMSNDELQAKLKNVSVFARVSPEDKLRIVDTLQGIGQVVAMTGDGVNDSPALKKADIGVAMGITGTDVAKEAADMVLLDDNFATIVAAVEEGRVIYDNLLRFVKFSIGGNLGKLLVMIGGPLFGINVALLPMQLLWLNLLTDGLMGLGLGVEPAEANTMRRPPRNPQEPVLDRLAKLHIAWVGVLIAVLSLGLGVIYFTFVPGKEAISAITEPTTWQTMIFAVLGFAQIGQGFGVRAWGRSAFSLTSNPLMTLVAAATIILHLGAIYLPSYVPHLNHFFGLKPLALPDLALAFATGIITFTAVRLEKRRRMKE